MAVERRSEELNRSTAFDNRLRPTDFDGFVGQGKVRDRLLLAVKAAKDRGESLDHVLFSGPPGLGKTTLSYILGEAMGVNVKTTSGPVITKPGDLAGLLTSLEPGDIVFIDEIHRMAKTVEEYLYSAMEDYAIDILLDQGPNARAVEREEEKTIIFEDGVYPFEKPVRFVASDYDFTIKAEHPGKAILSGSVKLTGWRQDENDPRLLVADLPFEPEEGALYTLASGSEWCGLASFPEKGRLRYKSAGENNHTYLQYDMKSLPEGVSLSGLDLKSAWLIIPQEWATTRTGIATNDVANGAFILKSKMNMPIGQYNQGFTLMNTRHGVRKPGMWMYEATAKKVVYWPREGETADNLDCEISRAMAIFDVHNTKNMKVSGLVMQGCAMSFANNNIYSAGPANAVFSMKGAYRLEVDNVVIRNTAGGGIAALKPVKCVTRNSHVYNVGGTAIDYIDGGDASDVINCHVHDYGRLNSAACGVGLQISNVKCIGNHIHDGPGNGVVLWSDNSIFASNHLHHVMQVQRDGGGLYGGYNNTLVKDNYVHDIGGWPGLYADEGSQNSVFCGNTFENCWWPTHMHQTQFITVSNKERL